MAFALRRRRHIVREQRVFKRRKTLTELSDSDVKEFRLTRERLEQLVDGYGDSEYSNHTDRSQSLPPETQVNTILCSSLVAKYLLNMFPVIIKLFEREMMFPRSLYIPEHYDDILVMFKVAWGWLGATRSLR